PSHQADQHQPSIQIEHSLVLGNVISPHWVEDHIGTAPGFHRLHKAAVMTVPAGVRSQRLAILNLLRVSYCDKTWVTKLATELDCRRAHPTGAGMKQHPLTGLQSGFHIQIQPSRGEDLGQCGRFPQTEPLGNRQYLQFRHHHLLRVPSPREQGTDFIAYSKSADVSPYFFNPTAHFQPQHLRGARRRWIVARPLHQIRTVHSSPGNPNAHFVSLKRAGAWVRDRKSTRLNSSHVKISYAVFCLKKKMLNTLTARGFK